MSRNKREGLFIGRVKKRQWVGKEWTPWEFKRRQGHGVFKTYLALKARKKAYAAFNKIHLKEQKNDI